MIVPIIRYRAPYGPEPKPCMYLHVHFSQRVSLQVQMNIFSLNSCLGLHFVDSSVVVIGSDFIALAQNEARPDERE